MRTPRRYRIAVLAYPSAYREARGAELMATLADGDDDRGGPSTREAAALAYRGLLKRARLAVSPGGLLAIVAVLVLLTILGGLTWAERVYTSRGEVAVTGTDGPDGWWIVALVACAFAALAATWFDAVEDPRRRRRAGLLAFPVAVLLMASPSSSSTTSSRAPPSSPTTSG